MTGPRSEPPIPTFTTLRMRLPVNPFQAPPRTWSAKLAIRSRTACTSGTTSLPSTRMCASRGARRATCSTARCSVALILSPENMASRRAGSPRASARAASSRMVSSVTRCLE